MFIAFLHRENLLKEFFVNLKNDEDNNSIQKHFKINRPRSFLAVAFYWCDTPEGVKIWSKLDAKWRRFLIASKNNQRHRLNNK
jgi:hypothetical protein